MVVILSTPPPVFLTILNEVFAAFDVTKVFAPEGGVTLTPPLENTAGTDGATGTGTVVVGATVVVGTAFAVVVATAAAGLEPVNAAKAAVKSLIALLTNAGAPVEAAGAEKPIWLVEPVPAVAPENGGEHAPS